MDDPLEPLSSADLGVVLIVALGLIAVWATLFPTLKTESARNGIIDLELSWKPDRARDIVDSWDRQQMLSAASRSLALDWPFIVFYGFALATLGVLAGRAADASNMLSDDHAGAASGLLTLAALSAACLDIGENVGLWLMLRRRFLAGLVPATASLISLAKWILLAIATLCAGAMTICAAAWWAALKDVL